MNRTLYYYLFGKFRSRLTSAENAIAGISEQIGGETENVSALADRVTSAENAITEKADASDLSTLAGRVTDAENAISGKAAASDLSDLADRVSTAETAINGKASSSDLSTLAGRVTDAENALSGKASASDLSTLAGRVSDAETAISGKASASDLSTLAGRVTSAEGTIAEHTTALSGKAAASDVTALAGRVTQAETSLSGKANTSDLSGFALADHTHNFGAMAEITKFEVYATNAVIPAGTVDADTGLAYAVDVPAGMTHTFKLRSDTPQAQQDVSIDWGDGAISALRSGNFDALDDSEFDENGELVYTVSHTYTTPGKYIVTISGKGYWGMQTLTTSSILSRIFASDLPVASWIKNLSNAAQYSPKLQKVMIPTGMDFFVNIHNASGMFQQCKNLLSVTNMATKFQYTRYVQNMFNGCEHMVTCDFRIPQNCIKEVAYRCVYKGCAALTANIADLLPERGFDGTKLNFLECFRGCASLTGTVPAAILWEDMRIVWSNTANVFTGCSAEIRSQVPESWGGTGSEIEDPHPISRSQIGPVITSKVDEALQNLNIQSGGSNSGVGNILGGYAARILAYEETTANDVTTYTIYLAPDTDEVDWTKFEVGQSVRISVPDNTTEQLMYAEIATIDSSNAKLTLTAALNLPSGTTLGMEKRTVSGYTGTATGGLTAYRVTYSGAGTDSELCEGRDVYTRAGSGAFVKNSIQGTLGNYIFLTSAAISGTNAIYLPPSNAILSVAVAEDDTICSASGEYNTVVGEASSAEGAYNVVFGGDTHVSGSDNKVFGDNSTVSGTSNLVNGPSNYVWGISNTVADGLNIVVGDGNIALRQGAIVIGDRNTIASVKGCAYGWMNTIKAYGGMAFGTNNKVNGKYSVAVGYSNNVAAETAYVVGRYADVPDAAENKNGFFIWGGHNDDNALAFSVRVFRAELNPLFNGSSLAPGYSASDPNPKDSGGERKYNSVPAYRTEYKGQLKPTTQTITISGAQTVTLDPTMYSRVMLTGSGTVTFDIEDYAEDGDKIELVMDTSAVTPIFPSEWVIDNSVYSLWTVSPGVYCMILRKDGGMIYVRDAFHVSTSGQLEELIQAGVSLQFSADGENWHNDQRAGDTYVRFKLAAGGAWTSAIEMPKISSIFIAACSGLGEYLSDNAFTMTWIDPENVTLNGATLAEWNQTVLVRKVGSYPADHTDGTILATTSRELGNKNAYRSTGYTDSERESGTTYYYKLFSQTTAGVWNNPTGNQFVENTNMSWGMVQAFVRAGRGPELFPVGTVFEVEHPEYTVDGHGIYFRVVGHDQVPAADETLTHTMCLDMVDVLFVQGYDEAEYEYAITADTTAQAGKSYYVYSGSSYTKLIDGTDYDVGDPVPVASWYEKNLDGRIYGSNNAEQSNMIQWANSTGAANQWFVPQTLWDKCFSSLQSKSGFMRYLDPQFAAVVQPAKLTTARCTAEGGGSITHSAKFWALSWQQAAGGGESYENAYLKYYADGGSLIKNLISNNTPTSWALRSFNTDYAYTNVQILTSGSLTSANSQFAGGYSLACIIG